MQNPLRIYPSIMFGGSRNQILSVVYYHPLLVFDITVASLMFALWVTSIKFAVMVTALMFALWSFPLCLPLWLLPLNVLLCLLPSCVCPYNCFLMFALLVCLPPTYFCIPNVSPHNSFWYLCPFSYFPYICH